MLVLVHEEIKVGELTWLSPMPIHSCNKNKRPMSHDRSRFFDPDIHRIDDLKREISTMYRDVQQKMVVHDGTT